MDERPIPEWQSFTTLEIEALVERDPVVVLPIAAIEQHGPHLPLSTDLEIGLGILRSAFLALAPDFPACVLPTQPLGASTEHLGFPGTLSLDADSVTSVIVQVGRAVARAGVRRLLVSNSHGGNHSAMATAGLRLRADEGLLVVRASYFDFEPPERTGLPTSEWRHGLHGGAVETSMMLHLRPDLVRTERLSRARSLGEDLEVAGSRIGPDGEAAFSWLAGDLNPSGVVGDPTLANAEEGGRLVEHFGRTLAAVITDARAFPLDRLR